MSDLEAGDLDGDRWDDIVIGTDWMTIYYNDRAGSWITYTLDELDCNGIALGDLDRGITQ